jgi:hypothetical protein
LTVKDISVSMFIFSFDPILMREHGARSELATKIGKGQYVFAQCEKIERIPMPLGDNHLLCVISEIDSNHSVIINSITKLDLQQKRNFSVFLSTYSPNLQYGKLLLLLQVYLYSLLLLSHLLDPLSDVNLL